MSDIPAAILPMMDKVWAFIREQGIDGHGHNVWLYRNLGDGAMDVEIGVQMSAPFTPQGDIVAVEMPAGKAAHGVHHGDYSQMGKTHGALMAWCAEQGPPASRRRLGSVRRLARGPRETAHGRVSAHRAVMACNGPVLALADARHRKLRTDLLHFALDSRQRCFVLMTP